ncbi:hypothetical protein [Levilactobacillus namurensis]|uniref:Uncharacterized protein n=1 Tax=Levilactobacillus namurensis TaxID=380393 RepID=A0AAW8W354_9LACO|nr:hypothetical protein [Levilactobacillus namurensis]MCW3778320.1 hypothetical protein [Levilactobacillus namurensis]MDT7013784.1 hypothetical protein [Levilactobacillus namurensis]MDT7019343.1 hypothetical protein [Levilactobacillus namurensis]WNN66057.1 hypothetical protein RIN67_02900 [Levilactobacillus namurensis]
MTDIFTILKNVSVNHQPVAGTEIVVTDVQGKPNGLLTDLVHDLINDALLFVNLAEIATADDLIDRLHAHTPLPDDVLEEYAKILAERCYGLNFAPQKGQIEIIVHR